jgi:hypothetical protein
MVFTALAQNASPTVSGRWQGSLKVPGGADMVVFADLVKNSKGAWIGSFSMPEIGSVDIPLDQLSVVQTKVHFVVTSLGGSSYEGTLSPDGKELTGTFGDARSKTPLNLKRVGAPQVKLPDPNTPLTKDIEGTWHGTLVSGDTQIRMLLKLTRGADGTASGLLVNVDQGNREVPITSVQQKDKSLDFEVRAVGVRYHGMLTPGGAIGGEWSQMSRSAPLTFERGPFPPNSILPKAMEGTWQAVMDAGGEYKIVLALKLTRAADGTALGSLKNTSDSSRELPVPTITLKNKSMDFTVPGLGAVFGGTLNDAGTEMAGTWVQVGTPLPLTFKHMTAAEKK